MKEKLFLQDSPTCLHPAACQPRCSRPASLQVTDAVNVSAFLQEASLMTRLAGGPHVVALHGACVDDQSLVVVMELLEVRAGGF